MSSSSSISLTPIGREQIHKLETALLLGTLFREDVLNMLKEPEDRLTWVDALAVAAAAIAREAAKMSVSEIADDLGRSEASIRQHLSGKSKAGKLVKETYGRFTKEGVNLNLPLTDTNVNEKVNSILSRYEETVKRLKEDLENITTLLNELKSIYSK